MANRDKSSRTYRDFLDNDVEIFGSTQGSSATGNFHPTVPSRPAKRASEESSTIRHNYNYKDNRNAEDGKYEFFASTPADNDDEDLSDF